MNTNKTFAPGIVSSSSTSQEAQSVLRNTYFLLALSLLVSAVCAFVGMRLNYVSNPFIYIIGMFGLSYMVHRNAESKSGILWMFAFAAFMGFSISTLLSMYFAMGAGQIVVNAFALTAFIFFGLSFFVLTTRKDMSMLSGFLSIGVMGIFGLIIFSLLSYLFGFSIPPVFHLVISGFIVILMSGFILYETSNIIHGGQTNYIRATIQLYMSIYNLFLALLQILSFFSSGRN